MKYIVFVKIYKGEISPFDEAALECALRLREERGGEIYAVTMAPESAADRMKALTRLGIDRSILITDKTFAGSDTAATSYVLSLAAKKLINGEYLILCGRQSMDGDTAQVGASIAVRLNIPALTNVMEITSLTENKIECETRLGHENAELPALITTERICRLRFAPMRAKAREIERWDARTISADIGRCGINGSPTKVLRSFENQRGRRNCIFLQPDEFKKKILELQYEERHPEVRQEDSSGAKLPEVYAVGSDVAEIASGIAERVITLDRLETNEYVKLFREKSPKAILFPSDVWGRRIAPAIATALDTGLCADCTLLETDGERLYMYRPAFSGNITAKIECRSMPQIATVRTVSDSSDIIVACGLGVKSKIDSVCDFADALGAEMGASRGLVDAGFAPYEWQIGITGRTVAPKIYIAIGISGAVHHTSAIEGSLHIFAINPEKNSSIFNYCDFGCNMNFEEFI